MPFDAMDAGVTPGGARTKTDVKLLICYLLGCAGEPVAKRHIGEIMQKHGLANYFEAMGALEELKNTQSVTGSGEGSGDGATGRARDEMLGSGHDGSSVKAQPGLFRTQRVRQGGSLGVERVRTAGWLVSGVLLTGFSHNLRSRSSP